jgi:hypothetical protein
LPAGDLKYPVGPKTTSTLNPEYKKGHTLMIDVRARNNSGARNGLRFLLRGLTAVLAVLFITSCGNDIFVVGTPIVTLTAQRGHFTSYIVSIAEIEMTRKDGTVIELPAVSERVDLANLPNFTQLLEVPAVGVGTYVSATFFLDYSSLPPYITVDVNGQSMLTTLIDSSTGLAPTIDTVTVNFDPNNPLVITSQQSSPVNFNIDLEASNTIDNTDGTTALVTVHPMFTVSAKPIYQQPVFARGLFVFADTKAGNFVMNTRPLHDVLNSPFGALTVLPNDQTYWNINGVPMVGAAGLTALAALQSQTATLQIGVVSTPGQNMFGNMNNIQPSMTAAQVYVGSSLESTIQDHITGIVASRANGTLQIMGAALTDRLGDYGFAFLVPVTIASTTLVTVDGVGAATLDSVSVGQFIDVAGQDTITADGLNNPTGLDATLGQIRVQPTTLWGVLNSATTTTANVSLSPVGLVQNYEPGTVINFLGTGSATDATAGNYTLATPMDESATAPGTLLNIVGLTNSFGQGPPYFTATTVTPASSLPQQLVIVYGGSGSGSPVSAIVDNTIYINLQDPDISQATVNTLGGPAIAATPIANLPKPNPDLIAIVPATSANQSEYLFTIGNTLNGIDVLSDPAALAARFPVFNALSAITKIVATGQYDGAGNFNATDIKIVGY